MKQEQTEVRCDSLLPALENGLQLGDVMRDDAKHLSLLFPHQPLQIMGASLAVWTVRGFHGG
jgi:hypothetical protein